MIDIGPPPSLYVPAKPAIIREYRRLHVVRFGLSYAQSRVEYDRLSLPIEILQASRSERLAFLPNELRQLPGWAIDRLFGASFLPGMFPSGAAMGKKPTTVVFLTSTSGSNQTWTVIDDWNSAANIVQVIGSGASGGQRNTSACRCTGGGAAAYAEKANVSLAPAGSVTFRLSAGPSGSSGNSTGTTGPDAWFNGTTLAGSSCGAKGGSAGGAAGGDGTLSGSSGGSAASSVGDVCYDGGGSGSATEASNQHGASGGGAAAGPNGAGATSANAAAGSATAGGVGDPDAIAPSYGPGSGGAGGRNANAGDGQPYGGGGGGCAGGSLSGAGGQALIVLTNNP